MSEKSPSLLLESFSKPLEVLKSVSDEKSKLKNDIITHQPLIKDFVDSISKTYSAEQLQDLTGGTDLNMYISSQIVGFGVDDVIHHASKIVPGLGGIMEAKKMFDGMGSMFGGETSPSVVVSEFISLRKQQPLDIKKIEEWMKTHGMKISPVAGVAPTAPGGDTSISPTGSKKPDQNNTPEVATKPVIIPQPVEVIETSSVEKIIQIAKAEVGSNESDNTSDKYLKELGYIQKDSKTTPRCGAFVSWVLMKSGLPIPQNDLSAKAFVGEEGLGHVGIKIDNKVISGNYGNKVSSDDISDFKKPIIGYAISTPSGLVVHKETTSFDKIPQGAILVFDRNKKRSQAA